MPLNNKNSDDDIRITEKFIKQDTGQASIGLKLGSIMLEN